MINSTLTKLSLSENQIGDAGVTRLSEVIRVNTSLESLYVSYNRIHELGATRLSEALMVNSTLFDLTIDVPQSVPPNVKQILRGKAFMNRLEKLFIPESLTMIPTSLCSN